MKVKIAYGKKDLEIRVPESADVTIIKPKSLPTANNQADAVKTALRNPIGCKPLKEMVKPENRIGIAFSDITRPTPNHILLPAIIQELTGCGIPKKDIILFNGTGTHREQTETELRQMLGNTLVDEHRIVQNKPDDPATLENVGTTTSGNIINLNREFMACSFKILTGFIEPHFFAGFSGGAKAVMPGLAGMKTIMHNHSAVNLDSKKATWGVLADNPLRMEIDEAASLSNPDFLVNVTLNDEKGITEVFAGDWIKAYQQGCEFVRETAMARVLRRFPVVITSNSGYPLDMNFYQAVKGMSAAAQIVEPGGSIIIAAQCSDGLPDHGEFGEILKTGESPEKLLNTIRNPCYQTRDQWQVQVLASIAMENQIYIKADGITHEEARMGFTTPCNDISDLLEVLLSGKKNTSVCILPDGPQTIPYVSN